VTASSSTASSVVVVVVSLSVGDGVSSFAVSLMND
jgi:hypothetical protein